MDIEQCLRELSNRYEILSEIGQGGMGRVYRARDTQLDRLVAIKIPLPPDEDREKWTAVVTRFRREGRTLAKLSDPAIMQVYDLGEAAGFPYMVSEWIEGLPLHRRPRPWPESEIQALAAALCGALAHAHESGVIHRDIKPSNILLRADGSPVLIDFGIARFADDTTLTKTGSVLGTLVYLAPELLMGQELGPPVDQYALGCVLYEMATGQTWVQAQTLAEIVRALLHQRPVAIPQLRPGFDARTASLIHQMIERRPEDRFHTMRDAMDAWLALADITGPITGGRPAAPRPVARVSAAMASLEDAATEESGPQDIARALHMAGVDGVQAAEATDAYAGNTPPSVVLRQGPAEPRILPGPRVTPAPPAVAVSPASEGAHAPDTASVEITLRKRRRLLPAALGLILLALLVWQFRPGLRHLLRQVDPGRGARGAVTTSLDDGVGEIAGSLLDLSEKPPRKLLADGHVAFSDGRPADGVKAYAEALAGDPTLCSDPALIANLVEAGAQGVAGAGDILVTHGTEKILAALLERSVGPGFADRHRITDLVERLHEEEKIDWGRVATLDLKEAPECAQRKIAVLTIEREKDKRAIPDLQRLLAGPALERLSNSCLLREAERTLRVLKRAP